MACVHTIHDVLVYVDAHSGCRRHIHWSTVVLSTVIVVGSFGRLLSAATCLPLVMVVASVGDGWDFSIDYVR